MSRYRPGTERDVVVQIPRDTAGGNVAQRAERATRWLWSRGIYPGPAAVSLRMHGHVNRDLNGKETKARNEAMRVLGIRRQRRYVRPAWGDDDPLLARAAEAAT